MFCYCECACVAISWKPFDFGRADLNLLGVVLLDNVGINIIECLRFFSLSF